MIPTHIWILGRGGMLGSHLAQAVKKSMPHGTLWECNIPQFSWEDPLQLHEEYRKATLAFAKTIQKKEERWMVLWAAGVGIIDTSEQKLRAETQIWSMFLEVLSEHLTPISEKHPGIVFLASSAGGVYGNQPNQKLTEETLCTPISAYGKEKLRQEDILKQWSTSKPGISTLIGRITNLYGSGQNLEKPQGIISHISRCLIFNRPIHIYVSLDTQRDYIFVADCANYIIRCLLHIEEETSSRTLNSTKLFASEQATTLAEIIGIFSKIAKKRPRIVCGTHAMQMKQPRASHFHSIVLQNVKPAQRTNLFAGIATIHLHQLALYRQGLLSPPKLLQK